MISRFSSARSSVRPRAPRVVTAALAVVAAATLLAGCTANDDLADLYREGSGQGYISGDGAYTVIPASERTEPIVFEGETDTGESLGSDDLEGNVVVVNFWYASCPPCRLEAPDLEALSQQFADEPVRFVGVNIYDQAPTALAFAEEFGVTYPSIIDVNDGAVRLAFAGQVAPNAVPTTIVLDAQGRVAGRISGLLTEPSVLRSMITDTLAEAS